MKGRADVQAERRPDARLCRGSDVQTGNEWKKVVNGLVAHGEAWLSGQFNREPTETQTAGKHEVSLSFPDKQSV